MKSKYLILAFSIVLIFACNKEDDHGDYEHNNETLQEMVHLSELHDDIHPH